jgi:DNA-directed RNA polymerase subunit N (RpoN/RPB10)
MLIPIRCFSCGSSLSDKANLFRFFRCIRAIEELNKKEIQISQANLRAAFLQIEMGDVIKDLGIKRDCCVMHLVSEMIWTDHF